MFCTSLLESNNLEQVITFNPLIVTTDTLVIDAIAHMNDAQATSILKNTKFDINYLLTDARASCVLVVEAKQLVGIFTERDVVRLIADGQKIAGVAIADVMTRSVVTLQKSELSDIFAALNLFQCHRIRHIPVLDDGGAVVGVLTHENLLQYLATQVARETQQANSPKCCEQQLAERQQMEQKIKLLYNITSAIGEVKDSNAALEVILRQICEFTHWSFGEVWLPSPDNTHLQLSPAWYCSNPDLEFFRLASNALTFAPNQSLPGRVWVSQQPEWICNLSEESAEKCFRVEVARECGLKGVFGVPLLAKERAIAILVFFADEQYELNKRLLQLITSVAVQLAQLVWHKQVEEALRQSEHRYASLASAAPVGIFRTDTEGHCLYVNDRWCEIAGLTPVEAMGTDWVRGLHPDDQDLIFEEWNRSVKEKEPFRLEYRFQRPDGKVTWVFGQVVAEQGADGETTGYIGTITDISDRKQAQMDLQSLVEGAASVTGQDFFPVLVKYVALALDVAYVLVAKQEGNFLSSYGFWGNGQLQPNFSFLFENTPCHISMTEGMFYCTEGMQQRFPKNEFLSTFKIESYFGTALTNIHGNVIGSLCIFDKKPLTNIPRIATILQIFGARVSAELERQAAMEALCQLNQELELRVEQRTSALRESEERWQLALRGSNDGIWDWNLQTNQVFFSPRWKEMRGFAEDEIGNDLEEWLSRIHPNDRDRVLTAFAEHFARTTPFFQQEYQVQRKDGSYMWVLDRGQALWDETGNAIRMAGSETDITERKQAEEILNRQLAAIEAAIDGIAILEGDTYTYLNKAHLELFGYESDEELIGSTWRKLYSPEEINRFEQNVFPILMQQHYWQGEATGTRKDGSTFAEGLSLTITESGDLICVCRDISKRKQVEKQLRHMNEQLSLANAELHQATRLKDEFLANMSHELRTPLNVILGMSEGLQEEVFGTLNPRQQQAIATIERSGKHLLELINDILDLSKIESGKLELQRTPVAVGYLCESSMAFVRQQAIKKNLQLTIEVPTGLPEIVVDERRIRQVLINLLNNAVKFTPNEGSVKLVVQPKQQQEKEVLCFSVIDTGIGIAQEEMNKLFQPFVQIDSSLNRQHTGTGLGLALVRQLVELHGGTVKVTSEVGQGSCFTVYLPYATSHTPPIPQSMNRSVMSDDNSQVLIVEDSSVAAEQIARYLRELNMHAAIYPKGEGAIDAALRIQPALIFLDLLLPNLSGWEVLKQLKAHPQTQNIPVVVISVVDERSQALCLGASEYLVKPITREKFRHTLDKLQHPEQFPTTALIIAPKVSPIEATAPALILLAEDNEANIATTSSYLSARGYRLLLARNGEEAVSLAKAQCPDLMIVDIQMPGMDGLQAMRLIRSDERFIHTPIIAMTALVMPDDRENCIAAGANDYLAKPVKLKQLVEKIKHLLNKE
ncbi:hypothetical protein NUACC21_37090 [Scytonema sp. NUACC21]